MSRAYCLTCNEQVHETPSGTCPLGHPVTAADHGPEPWVGFAEVEGRAVTTHVDHVRDDELPMERRDAAGRPVAHAGAAAAGHLNGHANGHLNGHANGHGVPSGLLDGPSAPPPADDDVPAGDGHAADDLAALLAEALEQESTQADPAAPAPADAVDAEAAGLWDADWDELSGLAAELQLDTDHAVDDGPAPAAETAPATDPVPVAPTTGDTDDVPDLDALLAELTGEAAPEPPSSAVAPPAADPAPPPPTDQAPPPPAEQAPPPPAEPTARVEEVPSAPPVAPPPPPEVDEPAPPVDATPAFEDVPSPAPVDDAAGLWDDVPEAEAPAPAPEVDLTNFTARGSRVGGGGSTRSTRSWFRKKTR